MHVLLLWHLNCHQVETVDYLEKKKNKTCWPFRVFYAITAAIHDILVSLLLSLPSAF